MHLHQGTDLNQNAIDTLEGHENFLFESGFLKADFSVKAWIDPVPLALAQDFLLQRRTA